MLIRNCVLAAALVWTTAAFAQSAAQSAHADIANAQGQKIGTATISQADGGIRTLDAVLAEFFTTSVQFAFAETGHQRTPDELACFVKFLKVSAITDRTAGCSKLNRPDRVAASYNCSTRIRSM